MADRPTPRLDVLIDRACRHLTPDEGAALRNGWAELKRAREERDTYRAAWHSARDRARKATEQRDRARRWAVALEQENARAVDELAGAHATIDHMSAAMSWIAGHDRQGLDHLEEAQYEARARESAVEQARSWARRAERAEQQAAQVRAECDAMEREQHPVADDGMAIAVRRVRAALDTAGQLDCPGETDPPTCNCPCEGCQHHCAAHQPDTCRTVDIDGETIRVRGAGDPADTREEASR